MPNSKDSNTNQSFLNLSLSLLMINTEEPFVLIDHDFKITTFNEQFKNLYLNCFNLNVFEGSSILNYAQSHNAKELKEVYKRVFKGEKLESKIDILFPDKTNHTFLIKYKPALNEEGVIIGAFVSSFDITEKIELLELQKITAKNKQILLENENEKVLAAKQKEFERKDKEALINNTNDLIWSITKDFKLLACNKAFSKSHLINTGKIVRPGDNLLLKEYYNHDTLNLWQDLYKTAFLGKSLKTELYYPPSENQAEFWWEINLNPIFDEEEIIGLACYCKNITENKILEEKLKQSEEQFRGAFNYSAIGMTLVSLNGKWLEVNNSFCEMIGYSKQDLLATDFQSITHPDDLAQDLEVLKNLVDRKIKTYPLEKRYLHKKGNIIWVSIVVSMVLDRNDKPLHIIAQIRDITEKKKSEEELQKSHELLKKLTDRLPIAVCQFEMTKEGKMTIPFISGAIEQIFPDPTIEQLKTDAALTSKNIHPLDLENYLLSIEESRQNLTDWNIEFRGIVDSKIKWIKGYSRPEKKDDEKIVWHGYLEDITERKLIEENIRISNERYEIVAKATNDAIYDWDLKTGEITRTGDGLKTLFGYDTADANEEPNFWEKRIHPDDLEESNDKLKFHFNQTNNHFCQHEYRFKKADGRYAFVHDKGYIIRNKNGEAIRMIGATQDITHRIETEILLKKLNINLEKRAEELAVSNTELEKFAYIASHDLQEPLRMITSFLNLLEQKYKDQLDDKAKQYIHFAIDGAVRMRKIILDLLEYSMVGRDTNETELVNTDELLFEAVQLNRKVIEEKNALIEWGDLPTINGHRSSIQQLFQNLIGNSLKYQKNEVKPIITISAIETKTHWQFSFSDNGIGIDQKFFEKIFILFHRLHNKDEYSGTGIGLAICKKIVENHGGKIWVESTLGNGCKFNFTIVKEINYL
jgi:two-component system CheB/CheR fusion protein